MSNPLPENEDNSIADRRTIENASIGSPSPNGAISLSKAYLHTDVRSKVSKIHPDQLSNKSAEMLQGSAKRDYLKELRTKREEKEKHSL